MTDAAYTPVSVRLQCSRLCGCWAAHEQDSRWKTISNLHYSQTLKEQAKNIASQVLGLGLLLTSMTSGSCQAVALYGEYSEQQARAMLSRMLVHVRSFRAVKALPMLSSRNGCALHVNSSGLSLRRLGERTLGFCPEQTKPKYNGI